MKVNLDLNDREVEEVMEKYDDLVEKVDKMMALLDEVMEKEQPDGITLRGRWRERKMARMDT